MLQMRLNTIYCDLGASFYCTLRHINTLHVHGMLQLAYVGRIYQIVLPSPLY